MPMSQEFELLAALGFAQYNFEGKNSYVVNDSYYGYVKFTDKYEPDSIGIRFGIGAQYNINEHLALRGMARYVHMTDDEALKNLMEFSLGLRYTF